MAVTAILSNHYKYQLAKKQINLETDSIKILLMRSGFVFDRRIHAKKANIKGNISRSDISFESASKHIHTAAGDFIAAGFVAGGKILVAGTVSNNGTKTIVTVDSATQMTVSEALTDEGAGAAMTIDGAEELATGFGYTQDTKTLAGQALAEDNVNDRAEMTCTDVQWTAAGGTIGPSPGAILYDDTSADKTIIGYLNFDGEKSAPSTENFSVKGIKIRIS